MADSGGIIITVFGPEANFQMIDFSISAQSIAASSTFTLDITLDRPTFTRGHVFFRNPESNTDISLERAFVWGKFGRDINDARSVASVDNDRSVKGYKYSFDSLLSAAVFSAENDPGTDIRFTSATIIGAIARLIWTNTDGGSAHDLTVDGDIECEE